MAAHLRGVPVRTGVPLRAYARVSVGELTDFEYPFAGLDLSPLVGGAFDPTGPAYKGIRERAERLHKRSGESPIPQPITERLINSKVEEMSRH